MPYRPVLKFMTHKNTKQVNAICPYYIATDWYQNESTDLYIRGILMQVDPRLKQDLESFKGGEPKLFRIRQQVCCPCPCSPAYCHCGLCNCNDCKLGQFDTIAYTQFWVGTVEKQASLPDICSIICPHCAHCEFTLRYLCYWNNQDVDPSHLDPAKDAPFRPLAQIMM